MVHLREVDLRRGGLALLTHRVPIDRSKQPQAPSPALFAAEVDVRDHIEVGGHREVLEHGFDVTVAPVELLRWHVLQSR